MITLSLDPSIRSCGIALWSDTELLLADRIQLAAEHSDIAMRSLAMAHAVGTRARTHVQRIDTLVFEWPQIYTAVKSKGDPNDLIPMAGVGCALATMLGVSTVRAPHPADWIGQCPKVCPKCKGIRAKSCKLCSGSAWKTPRGRRIADALTQPERDRVPDQHDVIDSVGLGAWWHGRLVLVRNFPGAV